MAGSDEEIEYLEEDAEIVQQCVRLTLPTGKLTSAMVREQQVPQPLLKPHDPLLVERRVVKKRKNKVESDSEYTPSEDELPPNSPSPPLVRKKRAIRPTKTLAQANSNDRSNSTPNLKNKTVAKDSSLSLKAKLLLRKKYNIRIPDYEDPLCLPVRAVKSDASDTKRLNNWNNVCLEHFKHCDTLLKPEKGDTKRSIRTAVFRNVVNKQTGNTETTIWSKTCVENEDSDKKSEIFQCVLPRYKEKKSLGNYILGNLRSHQGTKIIDEAILSKETHKDGDALVIYKPKESLSAVYALINKKRVEEPESPAQEEEPRMCLKELAACQVCPPCFQNSWRGVKKQNRKSAVCPICARTSVTVYNLLAHFKTHSATEVQRYKKIISTILSEIVGYHYKCRICRKKFESIKQLRSHIKEHKGKERFTCEVCNRVVN